jgi:hypothetical protein
MQVETRLTDLFCRWTLPNKNRIEKKNNNNGRTLQYTSNRVWRRQLRPEEISRNFDRTVGRKSNCRSAKMFSKYANAQAHHLQLDTRRGGWGVDENKTVDRGKASGQNQ